MENRLGLASITGLFAIVAALSLGEKGCLAGLVLGDLVLRVLLAGLALAIGLTGLGDVDLPTSQSISYPGNVEGLTMLCEKDRHPPLSVCGGRRLL